MYQANTLDDIRNFYDEHLTKHTSLKSSPHYCWILKLMRPKKDARFLDVACGAGFMLAEAEKIGLKTYGIDISPVAVKLARENVADSHILIGDGENLPWPDNFFDYVTSLGSLEHYLDPEKGLEEIRRVLKKEGLACIMLPNSFSLRDILTVLIRGKLNIDEQEGVSTSAPKNTWIEMIEKNGLKIKKIYKCNEVHSLIKRNSFFKFKSFKKFAKSFFIRLFCPLNLAECFVFMVVKNEK